MRARGLVVVLALILATLATAGVFLYAQGVKENAQTGGAQTTVIVSTVDIPANSDLNALIRDGKITTQDVPTDGLVEGAVTNIDQLRDKRNSVPIFAGEQILASRIQGEGVVPGGALGIEDGYQAMTVNLDAPRAVGGSLFAGDNVTILATFDGIELVKVNKKTGVPTTGTGTSTTGGGQQIPSFDATVVLVPQVEILRVIRPAATSSSIAGQETQQATSGDVSVTLQLTPQDAQKFTFALEEGTVWLSLQPPGAKGVELDPLTIAQIIAPTKPQK